MLAVQLLLKLFHNSFTILGICVIAGVAVLYWKVALVIVALTFISRIFLSGGRNDSIALMRK